MIRRCEGCGAPLPEGSRRDRRSCSALCRRNAYNERLRHGHRLHLALARAILAGDESAKRDVMTLTLDLFAEELLGE